jgi:hypothetical protein
VARSQKPDLKTIEPYDVSYGEIRPDENWHETVQNVAAAIMYSLLKNLLSNFHLFPSRNLKTCSEKRKPSCLVPVDVENLGL